MGLGDLKLFIPQVPVMVCPFIFLVVMLNPQKESQGLIFTSFCLLFSTMQHICIAGTETSEATVVWAMTSLMKNPSALKKVQADIRDLVGQKGAVVEEKLQQLHYLDAVIKEALRLYPTAPVLVPRETIENCNIEG